MSNIPFVDFVDFRFPFDFYVSGVSDSSPFPISPSLRRGNREIEEKHDQHT